MKLKEIKCPNCRANISLKENASKGICEYCKTEFIIDDETIEIKHTGTIEITDDTSLTVANTTLNQFKDYDKSLLLYRRLMHKYAHKKDIYIGIIRSITYDFKANNIASYQLNEINDCWQKYITLATNKEISKYEESIKRLNKEYWYNLLTNITNNFNPKINGEKIDYIQNCYNTYQKYCDKKDSKLEFKYKEYLKEYKNFIEEKQKKRKNILKITIIIIIFILLTTITFLLLENTKKTVKSIKLSEINEHSNIQNNYQYFEKYFKNTISDLQITDVKLNNEDKTVTIKVLLKNILRKKNKEFKFSIIDDMGPIIESTSCSFTDTEEVDVYKCFTLYDFSDGNIDSKKAKVNTEGINFKEVGNKSINVSISDKDGNENKTNIIVIITKTPIELNMTLDDKLIVGNTYNISSKINPTNVSDTTISYTYDKNFISINNNKIKALKKGQTEICAISNYNNEKKVCKTITLELQCKDTYTFNFDGSKEEIITSNENFCPGTYKIYANVMNRNNFYHLKIKQKNSHLGETMTIYKNSNFLNEEGSKYALTEGYTITTEIGITQVKLVKQK